MKSKTLWGLYDGEPFMENPQLGVLGLNPKRRKRGHKMAVRRRRRANRRGRKHNARRTRRVSVRRNPRRRTYRRRKNWATAGSVVPALAGANPRKHRRHRRRRNPVMHHRRRHARRNPAILGFALPPMKSVLFAGVGFVGPSFVSGFLNNNLPSVMSSISGMGNIGKYVVKIGSVLGLAWLTKRFVGQQEASYVLVGGAANVAMTIVNDYMPGVLPANPLSTYIPTTMQSYVPLSGAGRGVHGMRGLRGLQANVPRGAGIMTTVGGSVGRNGAYGGVAQRYFKY